MSKFIPRHIEVTYDSSQNPIHLDMSGETIEGSGVATNTHIQYALSGADQTNFAAVISAIKTAKGR